MRINRLVFHVAFAALLTLISPITIHAQLVADSTTKIINGTSTNITGDLTIGTNGPFTTLIITNAGTVANTSNGIIGDNSTSKTNQVIVTGSNSAWTNRGELFVGQFGSASQLTVGNVAIVLASNLYLGFNSSSSNNTVTLQGGSIIVTNAAGTSVVDVRRGTLRWNSGLLRTDRLLATNGSQSVIDFNEGTLQTRDTTCSNGAPFGVGAGNAISPGTLELLGNGTHRFANGLEINRNSLLTGNGTIIGDVTVDRASLSPGASIGQITINGNLTMTGTGGTNYFELNKTLGTNDNIVGLTNVTYTARLVVTNLDGTLTGGDKFKLYSAISYGGLFSSITLPALTSGLFWTNKLLIDGSIEVMAFPPAERFWTNSLGGNYNVPANWLGQVIPFPQDNANFTNNATYQVNWPASALAANAFFNAGLGTVTQAMGSATWTLTNSYVVGRDAGAAGTAAQVSGTLNVTNAAGNALLEVRRGTLRLDAGTIDADQFIATNSGGQFAFNGGTLIVRDGTVSNGLTFAVGANGNTPAVLDVRSNQNFVVNEQFILGSNVPNCRLLVTNGGTLRTLAASISYIGYNTASSNNLAVIAGSESLWTNSDVLVIGESGRQNSLFITNGGVVADLHGAVGNDITGDNNLVVVSGMNSLWRNDGTFSLGQYSAFNTLVVENGGTVTNGSVSQIGAAATARTNQVIVTGTNSSWFADYNFYLGYSGSFNRLDVTNGGFVRGNGVTFGETISGSNNLAVVTGTNSLWQNNGAFIIGRNGPNNQLSVNNAATVTGTFLTLGVQASSTSNAVTLNGGSIIITNTTHVWRGIFTLNSGLFMTDQLLLTNGTQSILAFNGGTLQLRATTYSNGSAFVVGNGSSVTTLELLGNGTHSFAKGLQISANALLKGNGTIIGNITNLPGGTISPGSSIGRFTLNGNLLLTAGSINIFELDKSSVTNDNIIGLTNVAYGGALVVTNLGGTLTLGDNFKLFTASSYAGAFNSLTLPALDSGLTWTNKLLVDGSIEVISVPPGDRYWTNALGGNYDIGGNWLPNFVPTVLDNANFTNNASYQVNWTANAVAANAFFNANSGTVDQAIGTANWTLTNSYILGRDAGSAPTVAQLSGTLNIANATGNAVLEVRRGDLQLYGGTINTDRLLATNSTGRITNNGGTLITRGGTISNSLPLVVEGGVMDLRAGTPLALFDGLRLGIDTPNSRLYITNGGTLQFLSTAIGVLGDGIGGNNNTAVVSSAGSFWSNGDLFVGRAGRSNSVFVLNGGMVVNGSATVGRLSTSSNNMVVVDGAGSGWMNDFSLTIGDFGPFNRVTITNNGILTANTLTLGRDLSSSNNVLALEGGNITNFSRTDVRRGTLTLNSGLLNTDRLVLTNGSQSILTFNGGTLQTRNTTNDNGSAFVVGNGSSVATLELLGTGTHSFANGLRISANALLEGNGTIVGNVTNASGGTLLPGASIGQLVVNGSLVLASGSTNVLELNKTLGTNDNIVGLTNVTFGGKLLLTNLSGTLARGDSFKLFNAGSYNGSFSAIVPSTPGSGLLWYTDDLTTSGTLRISSSTNTWDGGGANNLWSNPTNWDDNIAPTAGHHLVFPDGALQLTNENDLSSGFDVVSLSFSGTSAGYSITGNGITLNVLPPSPLVSIVATGAVTHAFSPDITFTGLSGDGPGPGGTNTISVGAGTTLRLGMLLINEPGTFLKVGGDGVVDFAGQITGISGFIKNGAGTDILRAAFPPNGYGGVTKILGGSVKLLDDNALGDFLPPTMANTIVTNNAVLELSGNLNVPEFLTISGGAQTATLQNTSGTNIWQGSILLAGGDSSAQIKVITNKLTIYGMLSGKGFTKIGPSLLVLNGDNAHTNTTRISEGPLLVNGAQPGSPVILDSSASVLLGGSGTVGNVTASGVCTISPGTSTGILTCSNLMLTSSTTNTFELNGPVVGTGYDQLSVKGTVNLAGSVLNVVLGYTPTNGTTFVILTNHGAAAITGTFAGLSEGSTFTVNSRVLNISYVGGSGNDVVLTDSTPPPPGDRFWTNALGGNYDVTTNWLDGLVPFPQDNANFTNNASYQVNWPANAAAANAYFNANSGTVTQAIGSASWTLTNSYIVGRDAGATANVAQVSGTLNVTNAVGNAVLEARRGTLQLNAGTIVADQFIATNSVGQFTFNGGTLITRGGTISNGLTFAVGASGSTPAVLDVRSNQSFVVNEQFVLGSNAPNCRLQITNGGTLQTLSPAFTSLGANTSSSNNVVTVSGAGSLWTNSGNLFVGSSSSFNSLIIADGGVVANTAGEIGAASGNNVTVVTGTNSLWKNAGALIVGLTGSFNTLMVTNGGTVTNTGAAVVSSFSTANSNQVIVTGFNSTWRAANQMTVGSDGSFNRLEVSDGGLVQCLTGTVGGGSVTASNNAVVVTGTNSIWKNRTGLDIGISGMNNQLIVSNAGSVMAASLTVGGSVSSSNNTVTLDGGNIIISNQFGTTVNDITDIRRGTFVLNSGVLYTEKLSLTNGSQSVFDFNGGTLQTRNTTNNGPTFTVGNGVSAAALELFGNGTNAFATGLQIANNALLKGNGTIIGNVTNATGGTISPGASIGILSINGSLILSTGSSNVFELNKALETNDSVVGLTNVTLGGTLIVTNLGGTLTNGTTFKLFSASNYAGAFSGISAASPGAGLKWNINRLPVDGVLRVVIDPSAPPTIVNVTRLNGTNVVLNASGGVSYDPVYLLTATNAALPITNWISLSTNYFDSAGNVSVTNAMTSDEPSRYFRLQVE